jgi:hypothetical protein
VREQHPEPALLRVVAARGPLGITPSDSPGRNTVSHSSPLPRKTVISRTVFSVTARRASSVEQMRLVNALCRLVELAP